MVNKTTATDAKQNLKSLLAKHNGDGAHPDVEEALNHLLEVAEKERDAGLEWSPTDDEKMIEGRWRAIAYIPSPFPGKLPNQDDGKLRYTLGRLSFGMYAPTKMICAVDTIINVVEPISEDANDILEKPTGKDIGNTPAWSQTYSLEVLVDIETPSAKLPATLTNFGICFPKTNTRLGVKFTSGTLTPRFDISNPDNATLASLWKGIFDCAIAKEAEERSYVSQLGSWAMQGAMKVMMGLEPPVDTTDFTQTYNIKRPFVGYLDILYLDDDFRVTRGNKGTVVVVERTEEKDRE